MDDVAVVDVDAAMGGAPGPNLSGSLSVRELHLSGRQPAPRAVAIAVALMIVLVLVAVLLARML